MAIEKAACVDDGDLVHQHHEVSRYTFATPNIDMLSPWRWYGNRESHADLVLDRHGRRDLPERNVVPRVRSPPALALDRFRPRRRRGSTTAGI
jgi:hypothetical protein